MGARTRVALEVGRRWTFASALDWPGWCRRGKGARAALDELVAYGPRYARIVGPALDSDKIGNGGEIAKSAQLGNSGGLEVVGEVDGDATTDFGAPAAIGPWDREQFAPAEVQRHIELLRALWHGFDEVVSASPDVLRKGPRGGGRDRDAIADHVREAERTYGRKIGVRLPPRTPWAEQRDLLASALRAETSDIPWPLRYGIRRMAWHVADHLWEIEDRAG